jgi:F420-non-reducing hydrogenase iron-sulfur subunit
LSNAVSAEQKPITEDHWEPTIVGFACNWCTYAAADLAGTSRITYPPHLRIIRLMCTGRLTPEFLLKSFYQGADGIFIGGCHLGDCHYLTGNMRAMRVVAMTKNLLGQMGLEPERLRLEWISASEGARFAGLVADFVDRIRQLGPNPLTSSNLSRSG